MANANIPQVCSIPDCGRPVDSKGYCKPHYDRQRRHGDPLHVCVRTKKPKRPCSIDGCETHQVARGYCAKHWNRWRNHGSPHIVAVVVGDDEKRFWMNVNKTGGCWFWTGGTLSKGGYGQFQAGGRTVYVHRYSFFLHNGYWPEPMCLHSCDTPLCVNPDHLREGDGAANMQDRTERGRSAKGSRSGTAKLTESQVAEIKRRCAAGESPTGISREFGVHASTIFRIKAGKWWRHVE